MVNARKQELNFLRIFACLLVISSHLLYSYVPNLNFSQWRAANIYYVGRNACVPLFFGLTGILVLKREHFQHKYIARKIVFYAVIYISGCTFYNLCMGGQMFADNTKKYLGYDCSGDKESYAALVSGRAMRNLRCYPYFGKDSA